MAISAADVKVLRERTGAGMMDCKKALEETGGDMEAAIDLLRSRGASKAAKRAGKETTEGAVATHVDAGSGVGALVELNCETDFVARTEQFQDLARRLAEHVAGHAASVDGDVSGDAVLDQGFMGGEQTVGELVTEVSARTGEKVVLRRVSRFGADGGRLGAYVHMTGKIGVLVELSAGASEDVARDVAMHIAASRPLAITSADIPQDVIDRERAIYVEQVRQEGKPENIQEKIVDGKMKRFFKEQTLVGQPFVKDPDRTVSDLLGPMTVLRFARYELGD
jgi:elongation factor Ts